MESCYRAIQVGCIGDLAPGGSSRPFLISFGYFLRSSNDQFLISKQYSSLLVASFYRLRCFVNHASDGNLKPTVNFPDVTALLVIDQLWCFV